MVIMDSYNVNGLRLRFSFDMGTNSLGWAVYAVSAPPAARPLRLLDLGVALHGDGRKPKDFTTLKQERGQARRGGRHMERKARRLRNLAEVLRRLDLLPPRAEARLDDDVYRLRAEALRRPLTRHELGRVFMHLGKHRGYKSNRRWQDNREDEGQIVQAIGRLREAMAGRTLGEYQAERLGSVGQARFRDKTEAYPERSMVEEEFDRIRLAQAPHHPGLAGVDWERIRKLFDQRPLKAPAYGRCRYTGEDRAPRALPSVQRLRYWETLLNLRLKDKGAPPEDMGRPMTADQLAKAAALLERDAKPSLAAVRKTVGAGRNERFTVELKAEKPRKDMPGNNTACRLRDILGAGWDALSEEGQEEIVEALLSIDEARPETEAPARTRLAAAGLSDAETEALVEKAVFEQGTHAFGRTVVRTVLPLLRAGMMTRHALDDAGFVEPARDELLDRLPYYGEILEGDTMPARGSTVTDEERRFGRLPNDTVHIALNRLRKVFNALCDAYGVPAEVNIETTRSVNASQEERRKGRTRQGENEKENAALDEEIALAMGPNFLTRSNRRRMRRRLKLLKRQNGICLYSGQPMSIMAALDGAVSDVDHVLPWSKTLDDSMDNLVLVFAAENRALKRDAAVWDAFADRPDKRERILEDARRLHADPARRFPKELLRRLGPEGPKMLEERDWLGRQLPETGHMVKLARAYLAAVVPAPNVRLISGRLTGYYREGLRLGKSRSDHRHHALDAAIVGLFSRSALQKLMTATGRGEDLPEPEAPWEGFADDLRDRLDGVVPWHRIDRKQYRSLDPRVTGTAGAMHDATNVGRRLKDGTVAVETDADGNPTLTDAVRHTHRLIVHRRADGKLLWKAVRGNGNAYLEVYRRSDGALGGEVVSIFDATRPHAGPDGRGRTFQPAWVRTHKGARLVMRLFGGDMVATGVGSDRELWVVRIIKNTARGPILVLTDIRCALPEKQIADRRKRTLSIGGFTTQALRLVHVDALGRVQDGGGRP